METRLEIKLGHMSKLRQHAQDINSEQRTKAVLVLLGNAPPAEWHNSNQIKKKKKKVNSRQDFWK